MLQYEVGEFADVLWRRFFMNNIMCGQTVRFRFKMGSSKPGDPMEAIISFISSDELAVFEPKSINGLATIRQIGFGHEYFYYKVEGVMRRMWRGILQDLWVYQDGQLSGPLVHYKSFC